MGFLGQKMDMSSVALVVIEVFPHNTTKNEAKSEFWKIGSGPKLGGGPQKIG